MLKPLQDVEWGSVKGGYQVMHCDMECKNGWHSTVIQNAHEHAFILYNLTLYQIYEFKIRAFNLAGASSWGQSVSYYFDLGNDYFVHCACAWAQSMYPAIT